LKINTQELVRFALESGASYSAIADTSKIVFREEFRKACEKNVCRMYNTNWMGPPAVGPISELMIRVGKYKQGLLFQTVYQLSGSFDLKGMTQAQTVHDHIFRNILNMMKKDDGFSQILPLNAGCCKICSRCAYLDGEECRHPDQAVASLEAYGIDVMALEKNSGIPYYNGKNTVSYVGLILFNEND
jgi:predicted metal-binding protein